LVHVEFASNPVGLRAVEFAEAVAAAAPLCDCIGEADSPRYVEVPEAVKVVEAEVPETEIVRPRVLVLLLLLPQDAIVAELLPPGGNEED
jgi:hypothetical protein